jgi:hypothetical protein
MDAQTPPFFVIAITVTSGFDGFTVIDPFEDLVVSFLFKL